MLATVSFKPYTEEHHTKIVTRQRGYIDCRRVSSAALVRLSSLTFNEFFLKTPMMAVLVEQQPTKRERRIDVKMRRRSKLFYIIKLMPRLIFNLLIIQHVL